MPPVLKPENIPKRQANMADWYKQSIEEVLAAFDSDAEKGLSPQQAEEQFSKFGPNEIPEGSLRSPWRILWEQFSAVLVLILIGAALLSALLGEFKDAIAIGAIVILFGLLGFVQEYRAEQAMAALRKLASPLVRVLRGGALVELPSQQIVPGDVILLEAGNLVPADARLLESVNLRIQEATLTGESEPVEKEVRALPDQDLTIGDRRNMTYMGTVVTYGRGKALIVETGAQTELGKVASLLQNVGSELTPLQKRLDQLGKLLAVVGFAVSALIFMIGLWMGEPLRDMLLTSVSIAVAIVPEGLPAVVTITLAIGAQRMLKRKALIRKLPAVETLGSVTVICSDKTGTLTENRMTVMVLDVAGHTVEVSEEMRNRMPSLSPGSASQPVIDFGALSGRPDSIAILLAGGALCNDASLSIAPDSGRIQTIGDPTEAALLIAAARFNLMKDQLQIALPRLEELPFDSERKLMTTLHRFDRSKLGDLSIIFEQPVPDAPYVAFTKGAVDNMLGLCSHVWVEGQARPLEGQWQARVQKANDELAAQGMRVLGVAVRAWQEIPAKSELESKLTLVGLFGMIDPPRAEVRDAVQTCLSAGIRPVMITGDHPLTAREIARQLGIIPPNSAEARALTGQELSRMDDNELMKVVEEVSVFARVSPEHKLRIVQALKNKGEIVSMTGDGVNDAPALKRADIGVAMGITGTDVAKEASDMVLQDDNFATIVAAVEEGRTIYDNLRKFVKFSVAGNIGKVSVMLLAPFLGKPLPLEPLQLLWLNLLTDGLLGLGLGLEPPEKDIMRRPPYSPKEGIFSGGLGRHVVWVGALIGVLALGIGYIYWKLDPTGPWQTMTFTTLAFSQMAQALATRSRRESFFRLGLTSNVPGMILAGVVFLLQLAVLYVPFLQNIFYTRPLSLQDLAISLALSSLVFWMIELEKWFIRRKEALAR
jgi:Ca2+-transporting ATPase